MLARRRLVREGGIDHSVRCVGMLRAALHIDGNLRWSVKRARNGR